MGDDLENPKCFGPYVVDREIGRGGMGIVYLVRHRDTGSTYALKALAVHRAVDPKNVERFRREAGAARRLEHQNIVHIVDSGESDGVFWLVMNLVVGQDLDDVLRRLRRRASGSSTGAPGVAHEAIAEARLDFRTPAYVGTMIRLFADIADALALAHESGLVHRDIKPGNLLLSETGRLVLTDFGLVRDAATPTLTLSREMIGTPLYMSPEQITASSKELDGRTDIYSLGITLYEVLTLEAPYRSNEIPRLIDEIRRVDPPPVSSKNTACDRRVDAVIFVATAKNPRDRYETMRAFADDLRALLDGSAIRARYLPPILRSVRAGLRRPAVLMVIAFSIVILSVSASLFLNARRDDRTEDLDRLMDDIASLCRARTYAAAWRIASGAAEKFPKDERAKGAPEFVLARIDDDLLAAADRGAGAADDVVAGLTLRRQCRPDARLAADSSSRIAAVFESAAVRTNESLDPETVRRWFERRAAVVKDAALPTSPFLATTVSALQDDVKRKVANFRFAEASRIAAVAASFGIADVVPPWGGESEVPEAYARVGALALRADSNDAAERRDAYRSLARAETFLDVHLPEVLRLVEQLAEKCSAEELPFLIEAAGRQRIWEITPALCRRAEGAPELVAPIADLLRAVKDPRGVPTLEKHLRSATDDPTRIRILAALASIGEKSTIPAVRPRLGKDSAPKVRVAAAFTLGKLGDAESAEAVLELYRTAEVGDKITLLDALTSSGAAIDASFIAAEWASATTPDRRAAVLRAAAVAGDEIVPKLTEIALAPGDVETRIDAVRALAARADRAVFGDLRKIAASPDLPSEARAVAILGLADNALPESRSAIIDGMTRGPMLVRESAAVALGRMPRPADADQLRRTVAALAAVYREDSSDSVRSAAVRTMALLEVPWTMPLLLAVLDSYEPSGAGSLLRTLLGESSTDRSGSLADLFERHGTLQLLVPGAEAVMGQESNVIVATIDALVLLSKSSSGTDAGKNAIRSLERLAFDPAVPAFVRARAVDGLAHFPGALTEQRLQGLMAAGGPLEIGDAAGVAAARLGFTELAATWFKTKDATLRHGWSEEATAAILIGDVERAHVALRRALITRSLKERFFRREPAWETVKDPRIAEIRAFLRRFGD
jgi:serine/threonine protein kinase/HEAT repeat protein